MTALTNEEAQRLANKIDVIIGLHEKTIGLRYLYATDALLIMRKQQDLLAHALARIEALEAANSEQRTTDGRQVSIRSRGEWR